MNASVLCYLLGVGLFQETAAFSPLWSSHVRNSGPTSQTIQRRENAQLFYMDPLFRWHEVSFSRTLSLKAIIYGPDGEKIEDTDEVDIDDAMDISLWTDRFQSVVDVGLLARLACAFAPPPHTNLPLSQIQSAALVDASASELNIAVAIASDTVTIQILVPVSLGQTLNKDTITDADLVGILDGLDKEAKRRLSQKEFQTQNYESAAHQSRVIQELRAEASGDDLPDWWTFPELKITLAGECSELKSLLNEADFTQDIQNLCQLNLPASEKDAKVLMAAVGAVGPSGLYLRAQIQTDEDTKVLPIALPFPQDAATVDDLRSSVLDLVESVEPVSVEEATSVEEAMVAPLEDDSTQEVEQVQEEELVPAEVFTVTKTAEEPTGAMSAAAIEEARKQPKSPEEEERLQQKYAAIEDLGERAYTILKDLGMV